MPAPSSSARGGPRTALRLSLAAYLLLAVATGGAALLPGAGAAPAPTLLALALLALSHAVLAGAALGSGPSPGAGALAALTLARGGMLAVILAWLATAAWPLLADVVAGATAGPGTDFRAVALIALAGAAICVLGAIWTGAGGPGARGHPLTAALLGQWRLMAAACLLVALSQASAWHLQRAGLETWTSLPQAAGLLLLWLLLLPPAWRALTGWSGDDAGMTLPRRLRTDTERVVGEVLRELPLAGHQLRVHFHQGRPHVHLVGLVDDATDLDAEGQDVLRARLYERLRGAYPDLALDVHFTRDVVWANRGLCGLEQAAA
jgi:predicted Co/Zn/Cd cation transporter (cation efflux family)